MQIKPRIVSFKNPVEDSVYDYTKRLSIKGIVKKKGINIPCRVRLYEKLSGRLIKEVATDKDGYYEFQWISNIPFFVIAHDPLFEFNAVIQDNVVPK